MRVVYRHTGTVFYKRTSRFEFWCVFYVAPVRFSSTALGGFGVDVVFYNSPARTSYEASIVYYIMTHWACVYRVYGVQCANDLGHTGALFF